MTFSPLAVALVAIAVPLLVSARDRNVQIQSVRADELIILSQIMTDKRAVYVQTLRLTDGEGRVVLAGLRRG
jgi:hypothetical protein